MWYVINGNGSTKVNGHFVHYENGTPIEAPKGAFDHLDVDVRKATKEEVSMITRDQVRTTVVNDSEKRISEDFPGYDSLTKAGYDSYDKIEALSDKELLAIDGIGPATLKKIRAK